MTKLNYWNATWSLDEAQCPCDIHFVEYLEEKRRKDAAIFHFGTGNHHIVGLKARRERLQQRRARHHRLAAGVRRLRRAADQEPAARPHLQGLLRRHLPARSPACCRAFDYAALFHVGEFRTPENDSYGALTDLEMTLVLADKLKPGGEILFYTGSFAYDKAEAVAKELVKTRPFDAGAGDYKTLRIFRKRSALSPTRDAMSIWDVYKRALAMLVVERTPDLLGRAVRHRARHRADRRAGAARRAWSMRWRSGQGAFPIIGLWAVLGLFGIVAGVIVAVMADRLAHRRRLAALGQAFEHAIILPISYHAEKGSGAVVRTILAGTDALFWNWLSFLREQFVALVGILVLVPTAIYMNAQHGADPGGAGRRLRARQRAGGAQDQHRPGRRRAATTTTSTAASATCSATSPWCRATRASPPRCRPCAPSWPSCWRRSIRC